MSFRTSFRLLASLQQLAMNTANADGIFACGVDGTNQSEQAIVSRRSAWMLAAGHIVVVPRARDAEQAAQALDRVSGRCFVTVGLRAGE